MLKIFLRTLVILLAVGLVAGALYLSAENGWLNFIDGRSALQGTSALLEKGSPDTQRELSGLPHGRPSGDGRAPFEGRGEHMEGGQGFSLSGLGGVAMQFGKIAVITAVVAAIQAVIRMFRRRRHTAVPVAV